MESENLRVRVDMKTGEGLIIDRPGLVTKLRRYSEWTYNLLAWAFWLFLLRPLAILVLWYLGMRVAYHQMVFLEGFDNPDFFGFGALAVVSILLVAFVWNRYNFLRFRGVDRRRPSGDCSEADLANYYKTGVAEIDALRKAAYVEIFFPGDEHVEIDDGARRTRVLYAPQDLSKHFRNGS